MTMIDRSFDEDFQSWRNEFDREKRSIEIGIDLLGDGLHGNIEFLFDFDEVILVIVGDEIDGDTQVSETSGTSDTMQVGFGVLREIEIDDHVDGLHVNTTCE